MDFEEKDNGGDVGGYRSKNSTVQGKLHGGEEKIDLRATGIFIVLIACHSGMQIMSPDDKHFEPFAALFMCRSLSGTPALAFSSPDPLPYTPSQIYIGRSQLLLIGILGYSSCCSLRGCIA